MVLNFFARARRQLSPPASNWVGAASDLAHELGHLLGLPDEYDYTESHATNRNMDRTTRLYWFVFEMRRRVPSDGADGFMGDPRRRPLDRHVCQMARLPVDPCVQARTSVSLRSR